MFHYKRQVLYLEKHFVTLAGKGLLPSLAFQVFSIPPLENHSTKPSTSSTPNPICKIYNSIFPNLQRHSFSLHKCKTVRMFKDQWASTSSSSTLICEARVFERQIPRRGVHPIPSNDISSSKRFSWFGREPEARESIRSPAGSKDSERLFDWGLAGSKDSIRRFIDCWSKLRRFLPLVMKVTTWRRSQ